MSRSRYIVGIDLGTSNSVLSYVDTLEERPLSRVLEVVQLEDAGRETADNLLPSFLYLPLPEEQQSLQLSFQADVPSYAVGRYARKQTAYLPGRVVSSAKSWLSHSGVDREDKILPWGSTDAGAAEKLSPVEVSAEFLRHFRALWNSTMGAFHEDYRFERQDVVLCVPASFDEVAQRLTLEAARSAGFPENTRLLEEPQAALYCWLEKHGQIGAALPPQLKGAKSFSVLIADIGGGTTDFSLFQIRQSGGAAEIERVAVGDHILLGGDNIDLTLAYRLEEKFKEGGGAKLSNRQWRRLVYACRDLKERLLTKGALDEEELHVSLPAEGANLFKSTMSAGINAHEAKDIIVQGFFPACGAEEQPQASQAALKEWGLPYAADTAFSRHLASFLQGQSVDAVLFNGGTLKPQFLQQRLLDILASWQEGVRPLQLENSETELSVARGASYFGYVLRQEAAARIKSGYARSLYLELYRDEEDERTNLICLVPRGFDLNRKIELKDRPFQLLVNEPVRFQLYYSAKRRDDRPGELVQLNEREFHPLLPLQTVIAVEAGKRRRGGELLDITLQVEANETGLLRLFCVHRWDGGELQRWELNFNLREKMQVEERSVAAGVPEDRLREAERAVLVYFGKKKDVEPGESVKKLPARLETILGRKKEEWDTPLLRALWMPLAQGITRRGRSLQHETTWFYLAGYLLRPGFGAELDAWRIDELWRSFSLGLAFPKETSALVQWWIMWRRVCGGLNRERQAKLYEQLRRTLQKKQVDESEAVRAAGSLERLDLDEKRKLAELLLSRIAGRKTGGIEHYIWALGRLGSRVPLYGSAHQVVPAEDAARWFERLQSLDWSKGDLRRLAGAFSQIARKTGDRSRDLDDKLLQALSVKMREAGASEEQLEQLREVRTMSESDQVQLFGDSLPSGLRLARD